MCRDIQAGISPAFMERYRLLRRPRCANGTAVGTRLWITGPSAQPAGTQRGTCLPGGAQGMAASHAGGVTAKARRFRQRHERRTGTGTGARQRVRLNAVLPRHRAVIQRIVVLNRTVQCSQSGRFDPASTSASRANAVGPGLRSAYSVAMLPDPCGPSPGTARLARQVSVQSLTGAPWSHQ